MNFKKLLRSHNFSLTEGRLSLLNTLAKAECPMSEREIEEMMPSGINKTTIYRNLNSLSQKGIIQKIISGDSLKYKLSNSLLYKEKTADHVHFQCTLCNKVICMEEIEIKDYDLPRGYNKIENQFLIIGICKDCNEENQME